MNILFINKFIQPNGITTYTAMLAQSFIDAGHNVYIISLGKSCVQIPGLVFSLELSDAVILSDTFPDRFCDYVFDIESIFGKFDLVIANYKLARDAAMSLREKRKVFAIAHDIHSNKKYKHFEGYRIIGVSDLACERAESGGLDVVKRIYPPIHKKFLDVYSIGYSGYNDYAYFPHRGMENKGISYLDYISKHIKYQVVTCGDWCHNPDIISLNRVAYPFYRYKTAAVTIQLSKYESFGLCAVESLYFGTPVVVFGGNGTEEIMRGWFDDYITPYGDTDQVIDIINNDEMIKNVNIPGSFFDRFDSQMIAQEYLDLI